MAKLPKKEIYTELESGGKIRKAEILLEEIQFQLLSLGDIHRHPLSEMEDTWDHMIAHVSSVGSDASRDAVKNRERLQTKTASVSVG